MDDPYVDDPYYDDPQANPAFKNPNGTFNWEKYGQPNTGFNANSLNLNGNAIPGQNVNPFSDPNTPAPNFTGSNYNGITSVDTASLAAFGQWVSGEVTDALTALQGPLQGVQVEPGDFYWADYVRAYINGTTQGTGMAAQFNQVIKDLLDGLAGISQGVTNLVQLYATTEDLNSAQAANLENDISNSFNTASSYFNTLGTLSQSGNIAPTS